MWKPSSLLDHGLDGDLLLSACDGVIISMPSLSRKPFCVIEYPPSSRGCGDGCLQGRTRSDAPSRHLLSLGFLPYQEPPRPLRRRRLLDRGGGLRQRVHRDLLIGVAVEKPVVALHGSGSPPDLRASSLQWRLRRAKSNAQQNNTAVATTRPPIQNLVTGSPARRAASGAVAAEWGRAGQSGVLIAHQLTCPLDIFPLLFFVVDRFSHFAAAPLFHSLPPSLPPPAPPPPEYGRAHAPAPARETSSAVVPSGTAGVALSNAVRSLVVDGEPPPLLLSCPVAAI